MCLVGTTAGVIRVKQQVKAAVPRYFSCIYRSKCLNGFANVSFVQKGGQQSCNTVPFKNYPICQTEQARDGFRPN